MKGVLSELIYESCQEILKEIRKEEKTKEGKIKEEKSKDLTIKECKTKKGIEEEIKKEEIKKEDQRMKDVDFSWEDILSFEGTTGPYVQYTYARAKSILKKVENKPEVDDVDISLLSDDTTYSLLKIISEYKEAIYEAANRFEPSVIARYTILLSTTFNKFYHECNILNAEENLRDARLIVVDLTQKIIKDAMGLLGIECPKEM